MIFNNLKKTVANWLHIYEAQPQHMFLQQAMTYNLNVMKNRLWYRGDPYELSQFYKQLTIDTARNTFWGSVPTFNIRKTHTGLPALIVNTLSNIIMADLVSIDVNEENKEIWSEIKKKQNIYGTIAAGLKWTLALGDGAFKITTENGMPYIEFWESDNVEFLRRQNKICEIVFKSEHVQNNELYTLYETYGYGYVKYKLFKNDREVPMSSVEDLAKFEDIEFANNIMLAVPFMIFESEKWKGRGQSIYEEKTDAFDAIDECWSQWLDAMRVCRTREYIPEVMMPRDGQGNIIRPNPFDFQYIKVDTYGGENANPKIEIVQPTFNYETYFATYTTALEMCLQGILSPSTIGIDTKKLDNAEAQREKEKTTLYTRQAILNVLQPSIKELITKMIQATQIYTQSNTAIECNVTFGEYANPSFEAQVETIGKAKAQGIMSIATAIEELYGDTKTEEWKKEETQRIKDETGAIELEEPYIGA